MKPLLCTVTLLGILTMSGCTSQPQPSIPPDVTVMEDFEDITDWMAFSGKDSQVSISRDTMCVQGENCLVMTFTMNDWAGIGKSFTTPEQWNAEDSLYLMVNSNNTNNTARVELSDNGGERFETLIPMNFSGWKSFTIPFSDFKRRQDWQPESAPNDGLTLTAVEGLSIAPVEKGSGTWRFDALGRIPTNQQ